MKKFLLSPIAIVLAISSPALARNPQYGPQPNGDVPQQTEALVERETEMQPLVSAQEVARLKSEINAKERQVRQLVKEIGNLKVRHIKAQTAYGNQERTRRKKSFRARELKSKSSVEEEDNDSY
jgi:hypothetical protein